MFFFHLTKKPVLKKRDEHCISRKNIDKEALMVLYRLNQLGYSAYLVGGSVRDLLLHRKPKDFDVGTNARPGEIRKEFRNCFLVGKRFRLAHIVFGQKVIETATFRKMPEVQAVQDEHGLYQYEDNTYGSPEEDAQRRDFTINGLFYNIKDFSVIDYVGGLKDLEAKIIRSIGNPAIRFREDPVRMMRAIRFAAKLGFSIHKADYNAIKKYAGELKNASTSRLCEEIQRLFVENNAKTSIQLAYDSGVLMELLPDLTKRLKESKKVREAMWLELAAMDKFQEPFTNAVKFAVCYHAAYEAMMTGKTGRSASREILHDLFEPAVKLYRLPRMLWMTAEDVLENLSKFRDAPLKNTRSIRFALNGIFQESLAFAKIIQAAYPESKMNTEAWTTFAKTIQKEHCKKQTATTENPEATDSEPAPAQNPYKKKSRWSHRRRTKKRQKPETEQVPVQT